MHEQTQRFILLLIFYLFGPILTLGIIGGIAVRKLPSNARSWERSLTQQTGLHWTIQSVEYRSPSVVRLHSVKILDEHSPRAVFHAKTIDVQLVTETRREKIFPGMASSQAKKTAGLTGWVDGIFPSFNSSNKFWQISVPASYLDFGQYSNADSALLVQNMLRKVFARFQTLSEVPMRFVFDEIAVVSEYSRKREGNDVMDIVDIFRFVRGNIYQTPTEIRSDWSFQIKDVSEFDEVHLSFALSQADALHVSFQTGRQPIPCDLAAVFCSPFGHFSGGTFQGKFSLSIHGGSGSSTIRLNDVVFKDVPLAPLVRPYTEFAVGGTVADMRLTHAIFGPGGTYAEGALHVIDGAVDRALFYRCFDKFQLKLSSETLLNLPMIPFSACAILFRLQPTGIEFWTDENWRDQNGRDVLMYYRRDNLSPSVFVYFPANRRPVTYHELVSIFAKDGSPVVPLTQGLQPLLSLIPTPP